MTAYGRGVTTPAEAKRLVIVSLAVAGGLASITYLGGGSVEVVGADGKVHKVKAPQHTDGLPPLRIFLGAIIGGVLLSLLADFGGASIAAGFAAVILLTAMFAMGGDAWRRLGKAVGA